MAELPPWTPNAGGGASKAELDAVAGQVVTGALKGNMPHPELAVPAAPETDLQRVEGELPDKADLEGGVLATEQIPPAVAVDSAFASDLIGWGDSMIQGGPEDVPWVKEVGEELGLPTVEAGNLGEASSGIAIRQGGLRPLLTVTGNSIPASGPVVVSAIVPSTSLRPHGFTWAGTLAGVPGKLELNEETSVWSFVRAAPGAVTECPAGTPFFGTAGVGFESYLCVFWSGRNNINVGMAPLDTVRDTQRMINHLKAPEKRYLVLGVTTYVAETKGTAARAIVDELNEALAAKFGIHYIDVNAYMTEHGLEDAGLNPTFTDRVRMEGGTFPDTLRETGGEGPHFNELGFQVVRDLVRQKILEWGWVDGKFPLIVPATVTGLTVGTVGENGIALTWTAAAGATGYRVEYRKVGTEPWKLGAISAAAAATVEPLERATDYEFRVRPRNVAGYGGTSGIVAAETEGLVPTVLTSDSFNRADSEANEGIGKSDHAYGGSEYQWKGSSGWPRIRSDHLLRFAGTANNYAWLTLPEGTTDHRVTAVLVALPTEPAQFTALLARYIDTNNYLGFAVNGEGRMKIERKEAGSSFNSAATLPGTVKAGDTVGIKVKGKRVTAYVNGVILALQLETPSVTAGHAVAFRFPNADLGPIWDDPKVYDL
jgi:hypothetical protein